MYNRPVWSQLMVKRESAKIAIRLRVLSWPDLLPIDNTIRPSLFEIPQKFHAALNETEFKACEDAKDTCRGKEKGEPFGLSLWDCDAKCQRELFKVSFGKTQVKV